MSLGVFNDFGEKFLKVGAKPPEFLNNFQENGKIHLSLSKISILIQSGRGGQVACPKCNRSHYQGAVKLRATGGVCLDCGGNSYRKPISPHLSTLVRPFVAKPFPDPLLNPPKLEKKKRRRSRRTSIPKAIREQLPKFCKLCGSGEFPHAHHKNRNPTDHRVDNLVVLCESCHCSVHFNEPVFKVMVINYFTKFGIIP